MGFLVKKEEEERGKVVVVAAGMEKEMEERMVEELVVEKVERMAGQGTQGGWLGYCSLAVGRKEEK